MRGRTGIAVIGLVLAACSGGEAMTTTTVVPSTSSSTTTTTLAPVTTTTTVVTTTTVPEVEGVPDEALALIGAPMPEVPEYPDGFDAEAWFEAYAAWNQWAFANPEEGLASLDLWVVPGGEFEVSIAPQLERLVQEGWVKVGTSQTMLGSVEVADEFEAEGRLQLNLLAFTTGSVWVLEETAVVPVIYGRYYVLVKPWVKHFRMSPVLGVYYQDIVIEPHD